MAGSTCTVTGMTCSHRAASVSEEVGAVEGVTDVAVDLPAGVVTVTIDRPVDGARVRAAVEKAGYTFAGWSRPSCEGSGHEHGAVVAAAADHQMIAGAAMAFSSVFVGGISLRPRSFSGR